jgi:hypothetical protein
VQARGWRGEPLRVPMNSPDYKKNAINAGSTGDREDR